MAGAQDLAGLAHLLESLHLLDADIEEPDRRPVETEQHARHGAAHGGEIDEMPGVGADRGAEIEHDRAAPQRRPDRRDRRALDPGHGPQVELGHRHQRAGIAGGDRDVGLALLHRIDGEPHGGFPAALAQRLARLVVHLHGDIGVHQVRGRLELRAGSEQRLDDGAVAEQQELDVGMTGERQFRARNDHRCPMVSPHGVERDADFMGHGATIPCRWETQQGAGYSPLLAAPALS